MFTRVGRAVTCNFLLIALFIGLLAVGGPRGSRASPWDGLGRSPLGGDLGSALASAGPPPPSGGSCSSVGLDLAGPPTLGGSPPPPAAVWAGLGRPPPGGLGEAAQASASADLPFPGGPFVGGTQASAGALPPFLPLVRVLGAATFSEAASSGTSLLARPFFWLA